MGNNMKYRPAIKTAKPMKTFLVDNHIAVLLGDIEAEGYIQYHFALVVLDNETLEPCCFVTSEVNALAQEQGSGDSHFLCAFDGEGHINYGSSNDWADIEKFTQAALKKANSLLADQLLAGDRNARWECN
jgi:hypothetical protein